MCCAQQVKEVLPEAVSLQKDVIPNVFSVATCASNVITLPNTHTLTKDAKIDIVAENGDRELYTIVDVPSPNQVVIDRNIASSNVFVYGEEVEDFHTIEKSYIYTLNVRATQVLSNKIDELTANLDASNGKIVEMTSNLADMTATITSALTRIEALY